MKHHPVCVCVCISKQEIKEPCIAAPRTNEACLKQEGSGKASAAGCWLAERLIGKHEATGLFPAEDIRHVLAWAVF